ncbi:uncharacterized protein IL334_005024 [Kwoniella shivajii]|uniref:CREG-like beta-barrel domain-containing protein n=1 Tax=Kwoniella shivajii TaxID=564305 RepID=A0ABZ1D201_9TREE|nr:hypothetical protein IL334_005024 [Kwoniella shivajii]
MFLRSLLALLNFTTALALTVPPSDQLIRRETLAEAAHNARIIVKDVKTGTMASVFPEESDLAGRPFAMMEYHAPCYSNGSLTIILMPISRSTQNIFNDPGHHVAYTVSMPTEGIRSPMSRGRVALMGNVTTLRDISKDESRELSKCYTSYHPDSKYWLPGNEDSPHVSIWARLDIDNIYYVGGFGDVHYIGPIPVDLYAKSDKSVINDYYFDKQTAWEDDLSQVVF